VPDVKLAAFRKALLSKAKASPGLPYAPRECASGPIVGRHARIVWQATARAHASAGGFTPSEAGRQARRV